MYTIGQVSEQFDLPVSTLRYYDKEGLFPALTRTSGIRRFGEQELEALRVIECLKRSGLEIKEIKQFMEWCAQGSETYPQRHSDVPFEVIDLVMDPGYNAVNRQKIESNAALLHIPVTIFETNIFDVTSGIEQSPCYLCARMRRGYLYSKARELGCNKIALGHHFSDVVETTVMGMFYGSQLQAMPPKLRSRNFPGMELIRPMYCIHEDDIIAWQRYNGLEFIQCACRFTERAAAHGNDGSSSKRQEVKLLLRELRRTNPDIEKSIFHSIHSVCLDTMVGYKSGGVEHTFADCYRERGEMAEMEKEDAE